MFEPLSEQMKHHDVASAGERTIKALIIAITSVLLFGGLYYAVRLLE